MHSESIHCRIWRVCVNVYYGYTKSSNILAFLSQGQWLVAQSDQVVLGQCLQVVSLPESTKIQLKYTRLAGINKTALAASSPGAASANLACSSGANIDLREIQPAIRDQEKLALLHAPSKQRLMARDRA